MEGAAAEARDLIGVVTGDSQLARGVRLAARRLLPLALQRPELVLERLESLRIRTLPDLLLQLPECGYARCVSVETFWRFHIAREIRGFFQHHTQYQAYLESHADPALVARAHLRDNVLVPAPHSWLVPIDRIVGLTGTQTQSLLRMSQQPPYLVMIFPVRRMVARRVRIREPRGIDAVTSRFSQWRAGDVPDERIDKDIPLTALGRLQWRP